MAMPKEACYLVDTIQAFTIFMDIPSPFDQFDEPSNDSFKASLCVFLLIKTASVNNIKLDNALSSAVMIY
jgi:hypothetical protein